jgi:ADP-ribose pyrophosphatase YjhB (NUDIX family)
MNNPSIQTITFIFDNKTDHILLNQITGKNPLERKHSGIKGEPGISEDHQNAAIRSIFEATGLHIKQAVLRGVVKTIHEESQTSAIYFVYESSRFSGEMENKAPGRKKWVDILNIFNLELETLTRELMPRLLDGESFFEGTVHLDGQDGIVSSDIRICNSM